MNKPHHVSYYSFALAVFSLLVLTGCDGGQRSGVIRGQQGYNANVAAPPGAMVTSTRPTRGALFQFQTSPQEAIQCQQQCAAGQCSQRCQRVMFHYTFRGAGQNFLQNQGQLNVFGSIGGRNNPGNSYVFDYNQFHMANTQWISDYNKHTGNFHMPYNMKDYCQNPSGYINESVNFGNCNQVDLNYLVEATYGNDAFNHYIRGNVDKAKQSMAYLKGIKSPCKGCYKLKYGTYWGKRNLTAENEVIKKDFERTWKNFKKLPENIGMRLANGFLNVAMTRALIPVARIDARLASMNLSATQRLNHYHNLAALLWDSAAIPVYITGGNCDDEYARAGADATQKQGSGEAGFVIGAVPDAPDQYIISCASDG